MLVGKQSRIDRLKGFLLLFDVVIMLENKVAPPGKVYR